IIGKHFGFENGKYLYDRLVPSRFRAVRREREPVLMLFFLFVMAFGVTFYFLLDNKIEMLLDTEDTLPLRIRRRFKFDKMFEFPNRKVKLRS
ncbi:hypothetical protein QZH41_019538, partial [Actinostola sp. cb2023]